MNLLAPRLLSQLLVATLIFQGMHHWLSPGGGAGYPPWGISLLFTVFLFILDDASRYIVHRALHEFRILWCFHRVHHTASTLTPLTIFRSHPVEGVLFALRSTLVQGVSIGLFVFLFGGDVDLVTILGANLFIFFFNVFGANLRHSTIAIHYPSWLERWLMSPAQHQIHHSVKPEHYNRNYGVVLSIWDRLGGTLHHSEPGTAISYGVGDHAGDVEHRLGTLYLRPFVAAAKLLRLGSKVQAAPAGISRRLSAHIRPQP